MSLTMTAEQHGFMRDDAKVNKLAAWVLGSSNHVAVRVRAAASLAQSQTPTLRDTQHMMDYLSGGSISDSDLVRLINGFNNNLK